MKNKSYMLPYRFRKYGYGLIIASVLSLVLGLRMGNHSSDPYKVHFDGDVSTLLPRHLRYCDDGREG